MKIRDLLLESNGKMTRGMLVQTLDQFVDTGGIERPEEIDEELGAEEQPVRFHPPIKPQYSQPVQDQPLDKERSLYGKIVQPDDIAKMVHDKNAYVIYYEEKAPDDPSKKLEKRITTEPIYIRQEVIKQVSEQVTQFIEEKFPTATAQSKKTKAYTILNKQLDAIAVKEAIKGSKEVQAVLASGKVQEKQLKAKQFTKTAAKGKNPSVHKSSVPIIDESGEIIYDLDGLAQRLMQRPDKLLKVNSKMEKSMGKDVAIKMANIGIPAIAGLVVDEKTKQFVVVNTCPGAGRCKEYCYATRGGYVQYANSSESQARILNYWYNDPEGFKQQVINEVKKLIKPGIKVYLRWHDSGDFFVDSYLHLAFDVAKAVPNATVYAYTKIAKVAKDPNMPKNFLINFSDGAKPNETKQIDYKKVKHSIVVPGSLFKDEKTTGIGLEKLQQQDPTAQKRLKEVLAQEYQIDAKSILTYDEMMNTPEGNSLKYNVIVVPGLDGDLGAARRDILGSYLLYH